MWACPSGPVLLGVVLGPLIEQEFRRALAISGGSLAVFVTRPIALGILLLSALILLIPFLLSRRREKGDRLTAQGTAQSPIRSSESSS